MSSATGPAEELRRENEELRRENEEGRMIYISTPQYHDPSQTDFYLQGLKINKVKLIIPTQ